jgi:hypothetical protein
VRDYTRGLAVAQAAGYQQPVVALPEALRRPIESSVSLAHSSSRCAP